jgi:hypothetical protein
LKRNRGAFTRAAVDIHDRLRRLRQDQAVSHLPRESWIECERLARLQEKARTHQLQRAERRVRVSLLQTLERLTHSLNGVQKSLAPAPEPSLAFSVHDIFRDLRSLQDEFEKVTVSLQRSTVSVLTDVIELEGVTLGAFEIVLDWRYLGDSGAYEVVAVESNPAEANGDTTHPHVQSNALCEGDGRVPIRKALSEGRLFDFFVLVRQILETYNPGSAYVNLEDWYGPECPDCGRTMHDDESSLCELCSTTTCYECTSGCGSCDDRFCSDCIRTCPDCDNSTCSSCLTKCADCDDEFCKGCLDDEVCSDCLARREEENNAERNPETTTSEAATASHHSLQPLCLGQAAVPA